MYISPGKTIRFLPLFFSLMLALSACNSPAAPTSPAGPSGVQNPTTVPPVANLPAAIKVPNIKDNLPIYTCAADAFSSYYTLEVMQQTGLDVAHGFHLAIMPIELDDAHKVDEETRTNALAAGQWDCLLTTLDSVALRGSSGRITAIIDESAGADQLWTKPGVKTLNDLRGHKIAVAKDSVGQFFAYYVLNVAGVTVDPSTGATIVAKDAVPDAINAFNSGETDAVSAWEPNIEDAAKGGGQKLIGTDTLRVIVDVIVTARQSIVSRSDVVQNFHDAWFDALRQSADNVDKFASDVAAWGHNDWTGVNVKTASDDLKGGLTTIAQASLDSNRIAMENISIIQDRIDQAKRVWAAAGNTPQTVTDSVIEPKYVLVSAAKTALKTDKPFVNNTFYMTSHPTFTALTDSQAANAQTLAVLPCRTFEFLPGEATLTDAAKQILSQCVVPILKSSPDIYLTVLGSAAWPTGETEQSTRDFAMKRANAVGDYLTAQGLDKERLVITATVPPLERRNLGDDREDDRKKDRFVQLTLILAGR